MRIFGCLLLACGCLLSLYGAPASIGIVRSYGEFRVDGAAVRGNSTLMAGDVVETMAMNTTVSLGHTELILLPESRAALYGDHTTLQRGSTLLRDASSHALEAGGLRIVPTSSHSLVEVGYGDRKQITVSAHAGAADVFTSSGELLASLNPGGALEFDPSSAASGSGSGQASASTGLTLTGKLTTSNGNYYVKMDGKTYQVTSTTVDLAKYVGKTITTTGSVVSATGGVTVVTVASVTASAVAAGAGFSSAVLTSVIVGAAAVGTIGGLGAAGAFSSGGSTSVSVP